MMIFAYWAITVFGAPFQDASANHHILINSAQKILRRIYPTTPNRSCLAMFSTCLNHFSFEFMLNAVRHERIGLGSSLFARRY